jgi:hypothetical protein
MQLHVLLASLLPLTLALPSSPLLELSDRTRNDDACKLPDPGKNCAGSARADIIVEYGNADEAQRKLIMDVVSASGSEILHEYGTFGYVF